MCRIAFTTEGRAVVERIANLQVNGGTLPPEYCEAGGCAVGLNRFTVTSAKAPHGVFPLESERFLLAFNGEVYGFRDRAYVDATEFLSDGHFAMSILLEFGVRTFLEEADLQGTFLIYDKEQDEWWISADQMNSSGCFYARWDKKLIVASEVAPIHEVLQSLGVSDQVPIEILDSGGTLRRRADGTVYEHLLRPQGIRLYRGVSEDGNLFTKILDDVEETLVEAVRRRIPMDGPVGVLCSGGLDSSIILAIVVKMLRDKNQLSRLKIFTYSGSPEGQTSPSLDAHFVTRLLETLALDASKHLQVISQESLNEKISILYDRYVYSENPRLITPNPILRSQVRNVVAMSSLLSRVRELEPDVLSLLSGDGADEIFAGYEDMLLGVETPEDARAEISKLVTRFPINDGGRVALAAFFGASAAYQATNATSKTSPVEIRLPYTSHLLLDVLHSAHPNFLFGEMNGEKCVKLILRIVAARWELPIEIILRRKIPFNEGATGTKNGVPLAVEQRAAARWMSRHGIQWNGPELAKIWERYRLTPESPTREDDVTPGLTDQMALVLVAAACGAERLFLGRLFRMEKPMPPPGSKPYFPKNVISVTIE